MKKIILTPFARLPWIRTGSYVLTGIFKSLCIYKKAAALEIQNNCLVIPMKMCN